MNTYEAMFLFDPAAGSSLESVQTEVNRLMTRAEAEVIVTRRLEERRLTFEIDGRKRGLYVLTYFRAEGPKIGPLERDIRLSEPILRALILRADHVTEEVMHNATLGGMALDKPPAAESESDEATGDASAESTKDAESTTDAESTKDAEPAKDAEPEKAADGSADSKPELVGSSAEPNEESESEA
ncbi:MAG: 30S ribosomal protein S6 [Planctomycetes bacterium]|nr:30S ribosomal protein S6 [Planctomycetota bacterium]